MQDVNVQVLLALCYLEHLNIHILPVIFKSHVLERASLLPCIKHGTRLWAASENVHTKKKNYWVFPRRQPWEGLNEDPTLRSRDCDISHD